MKNILVTGVSGEVGFGLIKKLKKENGYKIVAVDKNEPSVEIKELIDVFYLSDILDFDKLSKIFETENIDAVIHLASILSTGGEKNPDLAVDVNVTGTIK